MSIALLALAGLLLAAEPPKQDFPSLDELLKLRPAEERGPEPGRADLDRALSAKEAEDLFQQAVGLMEETASRLGSARDPGVETQRMQEDILRKLDQLLSEAERRQQQQRQRQRQQQQQQQQQQQANQPMQPQAGQEQQRQGGDPEGVPIGPERQEGPLRTPQAAAAATWGNLPPHVREALSQGRDDRYSKLYEFLTQEYYKRLAEDPKR